MTQINEQNKNSLNREDLFLLMKTYENSISLNTTLLEQHKRSLEKQTIISTKQQEIFQAIVKLIEKLENYNENVHSDNTKNEKITDQINTSINEINKTIIEFKESCQDSHSDIEKINIDGVNKSSSEHIQIKFRI